MIGAGAHLNTTSGDEKLYNLLPIKSRSTFSQVDYNNTTFVHTVMKVVFSVVILRRVSFTLLHNIFGFLPINGHGKKKPSAEINFHLPKSKRKGTL